MGSVASFLLAGWFSRATERPSFEIVAIFARSSKSCRLRSSPILADREALAVTILLAGVKR
ncbi:hypothetical protein LSP04_18740 [Levilactobacillus spicheri]|uniref:Secreted protein n=1 Tax=Levilactobacillus spicheri TaxID=216463 RepID=A0ABQ0WSD6_9LACO|nr:hypothetical protein LSP04_18740 [Levilactobacillus spicheri]